ncbi:MAG TPA: DUF882 domain-containing protein [Azospirillum sp.]
MRRLSRLGALMVVIGGILSGCATSPTISGNDGPRSVVLLHPASGESVSVTYWRPGQGYDQRAMGEVAGIFRDRRTGDASPIDPRLMDYLVELRDRLGVAAETPIHLTSGYRSQATNASLARSNPNVAENSYHLRGQAMDFHISGVPAQRVAEVAAGMHRGGYAAYAHTGHVHIDTGPYRTWTPRGGDAKPNDGIVEARATPRPRPAAPKAEPKVEVVEAPKPAETRVAEARPAPAPAPVPARTAPGKMGEADLARVRMVLVNLSAQDAPAAKDKRAVR